MDKQKAALGVAKLKDLTAMHYSSCGRNVLMMEKQSRERERKREMKTEAYPGPYFALGRWAFFLCE